MIYLQTVGHYPVYAPASASPGVLRYYVTSGFELSKTVTLLDASTFCEEGCSGTPGIPYPWYRLISNLPQKLWFLLGFVHMYRWDFLRLRVFFDRISITRSSSTDNRHTTGPQDRFGPPPETSSSSNSRSIWSTKASWIAMTWLMGIWERWETTQSWSS